MTNNTRIYNRFSGYSTETGNAVAQYSLGKSTILAIKKGLFIGWLLA